MRLPAPFCILKTLQNSIVNVKHKLSLLSTMTVLFEDLLCSLKIKFCKRGPLNYNFHQILLDFLRQSVSKACLDCLTRESSLTLLALSLAAVLKFFCWSNTFAELLWSTWLMWRTSADLWKFLHPLVNAFFFHRPSLLFVAIQTLQPFV